MGEEKYLVSIITPSYNCEKYIASTIESIKAQTYKNWELLIIDDCSSDKTLEIAKEFSNKDERIKVFKNDKNKGAAFSRNFALDIAKGDYVAFLDADDLWIPEKLEKQINFMVKNQIDFCYTQYELIDQNNNLLGKRTRIPKKLSYFKLLHHDFIGCLTAIYDRKKFFEIRSYDIKNNNDYGLFLQVIKKASNAMGLKEVTARYRIHSNGISRNKLKKVKTYFCLMHHYLHFPFILCCWFLFTNILVGKMYKYVRDK